MRKDVGLLVFDDALVTKDTIVIKQLLLLTGMIVAWCYIEYTIRR